jgi:hypothetical protein
MTMQIDRQAETLLRKAADDEVMARFPDAPDGPFGFHIQQAIEKLLKAMLSQGARSLIPQAPKAINAKFSPIIDLC